MSRHPYTNSCDLIRCFAGADLSRSQASAIRQGIAAAIGVDDHNLAERLSEFFQKNEAALVAEGVSAAIAAAEAQP